MNQLLYQCCGCLTLPSQGPVLLCQAGLTKGPVLVTQGLVLASQMPGCGGELLQGLLPAQHVTFCLWSLSVAAAEKSSSSRSTTCACNCLRYLLVRDFMGLAGRKARYTYGGAALPPAGGAPIQCVAKHDMETGTMQLWSKGPRYFLGEPQFIPRKETQDPFVQLVHAAPSSNGNGNGSETTQAHSAESAGTSSAEASPAVRMKEDEGWVLAVGFDAATQQSEVVVLDASDIEAGPIATMPLRTPVGYGLHGTWVPSYYGP